MARRFDAQILGKGWLSVEAFDLLEPRPRRPRIGIKCGIATDFWQARGVGGNHWTAKGQGFEGGQAETFCQRRKGEAQRILIERRKIIVCDITEHANIRGKKARFEFGKGIARYPCHKNIQSKDIQFLGYRKKNLDVLVGCAAAEDEDKRAAVGLLGGKGRTVRLPSVWYVRNRWE